MSVKKQYLKSKPVCKVTFKLTKEDALGAKNVTIVGEFNNWSTKQTPMIRQKNGAFSLTLELEQNKDFQFRYLIDDQLWVNDPAADKYVPSGFAGSDNSVVVIQKG
jgi:1,4-alpha-glucan branching enzyme